MDAAETIPQATADRLESRMVREITSWVGIASLERFSSMVIIVFFASYFNTSKKALAHSLPFHNQYNLETGGR